jgi:hypothetical protein
MSGAFLAIIWGGTACAVLDGVAASVQFAIKGITPLRVWQGVASGWLGEEAFRQGWKSGVIGLALHCMIAFSAATLFVAVSHYQPFIGRTYFVSGPVYGIVVYLVMNLIVVPLSARPKVSKSAAAIVVQLIIHIVFVGLPISISAGHFAA